MGTVALPQATVATPAVARIGPNAIIQVFGAARDRLGVAFADALLRDVTPYTPDTLPGDMVDEHEPQALVRALVERAGPFLATSVLREAGHRTGDYLLAHRIPRVAQWVMKAAPAPVARRILFSAMQRNAWTFAGSGTFRIEAGTAAPTLVIDACPMCAGMHHTRPMCDFYAGTFERLVRALVRPHATVVETECLAQGGHCCRFVVEGVG
jgi:divinyl protochlorophyllide a 8-vinyl-reductase